MLGKFRQIDWPLVVIPLLLLLIGIVVIYTVTFPTVGFALARSQIIYALLAIIIAIVLTFIDYRSWFSLSFIMYALGIVLLVSLFFIGSRQFGSSRWIDLGAFHLQPSELFKVILVLTLARLLSLWQGAITVPRLLLLFILMIIPTILVFQQPDLGTASVLFVVFFGMLLFAKLPWRWWTVIIGIFILLAPIGYFSLKPYQRTRITTFMNPEADPQGKGYNVRQAMIAIGSGGMFGQGLGKGSQSQLNFLPVAHTDFIFSGLAEATGLMGSVVLLGLYFTLVSQVFKVAEVSKDAFGMFVAIGFGIMFAFHVFVNIGMNLALMPVTGIPLPFVSSGGTSLIVNMGALGILQSIYSRHKKITF